MLGIRIRMDPYLFSISDSDWYPYWECGIFADADPDLGALKLAKIGRIRIGLVPWVQKLDPDPDPLQNQCKS